MKKIYDREIEHLGEFLEDSYEDNFIILFGEKATDDYREYCVIHNGSELGDTVLVGDTLNLADSNYMITAVGNVVNENLAKLGHITLKFDGALEAENPGTLHLEEKEIIKLKLGDLLGISKQ